jgi:succinate dehydrogenase/fumarate reductase flavoprotein subunit
MAIGAQVVNGDLVHGPIMRFIPPADPNWIAKLPPQTWLGHAAVWAMTYLPNFLVRPILMSFITTALGPDPGLFKAGGVLINRHGKRFVDEMNKPALALVEQDQGIGYIVLDGNMASRFTAWPHFVSTAPNVAHAYLPDYQRNRRDVYHQAQTIEDLALQLQMDPNILRQSLQENGRDAQALTQAPFVALGPVKSYMVLTDGGLQVSDRHEVIGNDGQPIAGLFAAGSVGQGGLLLYGHGHHLGWAFVSGRRAGRFAASHAAD